MSVKSSATVVSQPPALDGELGVAIDGKGRACVVWAQGGRVRGRRVLPDGRQRDQGLLNPAERESQAAPAVAALAGGHALAAWERKRFGTGRRQIYARWFDPADRVLGDAFRIPERRTLDQKGPVTAADRDFGAVVAWEEQLRDGGGQVFLQYLRRPGL